MSSTLRLDRLEPESPAGGTAGRFTLAGAEWTTGVGAGFGARATGFGFAFFAAGLAWCAFFFATAFAFAR
jgi:hypothetical protein